MELEEAKRIASGLPRVEIHRGGRVVRLLGTYTTNELKALVQVMEHLYKEPTNSPDPSDLKIT